MLTVTEAIPTHNDLTIERATYTSQAYTAHMAHLML